MVFHVEKGNSSKYCYDDGVLINCYDLHDKDKLEKLERTATTYRISQLESGDVHFDHLFQVDDYLNLHKFIFSNIYPFAGEIRTEDIYKSNEPYYPGKTPFCPWGYIFENLRSCLMKMRNNAIYVNSRDKMLLYLVTFFDELNIIHAFREGNGRTLRTYLELVVDYISEMNDLNFELSYSLWDDEDRDNLIRASILLNSNESNKGKVLLRNCFDKVLVEKKKKKVR